MSTAYKFGRHGGHVGGHLREPFTEMVDPEIGALPVDSTHDGVELTPMRLTGLLWNCSDVMPGGTCDDLGMPHGSTYAQGARRVRAELRPPA